MLRLYCESEVAATAVWRVRRLILVGRVSVEAERYANGAYYAVASTGYGHAVEGAAETAEELRVGQSSGDQAHPSESPIDLDEAEHNDVNVGFGNATRQG